MTHAELREGAVALQQAHDAGRYDRLDADRRFFRIWELGGIAFHRTRIVAIAIAMSRAPRAA